MKKVISALLIVAMLVCLVACGSKGPNGRYDLEKAEMEGMSFTAESLAAMGLEMDMYIQFNSDGTCIMSAMGETEELTWEGTTLTDSTGESMDFVQDGDTITISANGVSLVFSK